MFRKLFTLAIILLVAHFAWRVGPAVVTRMEFKYKLDETARFSGNRSENQVRTRVMEVATELGVPLAERDVIVITNPERTAIDVRYTVPLEVLPRYLYPWEFTISVDQWVNRR